VRDRHRKPLAEARRHLLAGQRLRLFVLLPRAAGDVAANHALEVDALGLAHDHEATRKLLAAVAELGRQVGHHAGHQMVLLEEVGL
jgi:hypothetical protein